MAEKLALIKAELVLPPGMPMAAAVATANEQMGMTPEGAMPLQVDALLTMLGLPRPPPRGGQKSPPSPTGPQPTGQPIRRGPPPQQQQQQQQQHMQPASQQRVLVRPGGAAPLRQ